MSKRDERMGHDTIGRMMRGRRNIKGFLAGKRDCGRAAPTAERNLSSCNLDR